MSDCEPIQSALEELKHAQRRLSEALTQAAERLRTTGALPTESLLADLLRYREQFRDARSNLTAAGAAGMSLETLPDLERALESVALRSRLNANLDRLMSLKHALDDNFAPLSRCQDSCRALQVEMASPAGMARVAEALEIARPLGALLAIVSQPDSLDDTIWSELLDRVESSYGRELATAIARNRLAASAE